MKTYNNIYFAFITEGPCGIVQCKDGTTVDDFGDGLTKTYGLNDIHVWKFGTPNPLSEEDGYNYLQMFYKLLSK